MKTWTIEAIDAPKAMGGYAQAVEVENARRLLFISGQIGAPSGGEVSSLFDVQCRTAWRHLEAQLRAADMSLDNVVKVTTFLTDRSNAEANRTVRQEMLGERTPALTVVFAQLFDEKWLVEIEAVAAA